MTALHVIRTVDCAQLAAMQRRYPEAMKCSFMSYLEEDDANAAGVPSNGNAAVSASNSRSAASMCCHGIMVAASVPPWKLHGSVRSV